MTPEDIRAAREHSTAQYAESVAELRDAALHWLDTDAPILGKLNRAAALIERQAAEIGRLREALESAAEALERARCGALVSAEDAIAARAALEAKP